MNNCAALGDVHNAATFLHVSKNTKSFDVLCTKLVTEVVNHLTLCREKGIFNSDFKPFLRSGDSWPGS